MVLWNRMRSGDVDAWGLLFERHSPRVYRFCMRFLGDSSEAEEVLSEAFLEAWRSRRFFVIQDDSALPILLAIARRVCQKRLRFLQRFQRTQLASTSTPQLGFDLAEQVVNDNEVNRRREWLRRQVTSLPVQFRDVFELVVYAELSYAEVSRVLGVPLGTVKSRMTRARHILEDTAQVDRVAGQADPAQALQSSMRGPRT